MTTTARSGRRPPRVAGGGLGAFDLWVCDSLYGAAPDEGIWSARLRGLALAAAALTLAMSAWKAIGPLTTSDLFLIGAVLLLLPRFELAAARRMSAPALAVGLIAVGGVIGTAVGSDATGSLDVMGRLLAASIGAMALVVCWRPGLEQIISFSWLWVAGGVISGMVALLIPDLHGFFRPSGLTPHPTQLAVISLILFGISLGLLASDQRRRPLALGLVASCILFVSIIASGSRAAFVAALLVVALALVATRSRTAILALAGTVAVGAVLTLTGIVDLGDSNALERLSEGGTSADPLREEWTREAWDRFTANPVTGEGFANSREAHNLFLQVGSSAGLLGILGALTLVVFTIRTYVIAVWSRAAEDPYYWAVVAGFAGALAGYLAQSMFQNVLWDRNVWIAIALMSWAVTTEIGSDTKPPDELPLEAAPAAELSASGRPTR